MTRQAVLVVDLQKDYLPEGRMALEGVHEAVANAARVIADAREKGIPVFHMWHEAPEADAGFFLPGSEGTQIIPQVTPQEGEQVLRKHYPNSFRETGLLDLLRAEGIEAITMVGAMSHICIAATGRAATDFGFDVTTIHDACATRALEFDGVTVPAAQVHAANMAALDFAYGKAIATADYLSD
ncbi:cysteine hydrolase [Altericroceibacterium spongiae]|uniref:Cysteine hydrolase n=1 Tax=Altericroceibacterium spongiae TaxID=2320269 RepID=A0A420EM12_9SPHN|nr:cysteine hydrolase family protein [Altericroceibacterium spongiae]RKF21634.1 cysteine hydrolase [Altericroceibacterium spongiae]